VRPRGGIPSRWRRPTLWLIFLALWWSAGHLAAEIPVPDLQARVSDLTGTLDRSELTALEERLADFESRTGSQIAVLIIPTTEPEAVEQYALRVSEAWQLGRDGIDDGALLLVALEDRKVRIEVGYGLEGALTDVTSKRIISEAILPSFRSGDISDGIQMGGERMIAVAEGEPLPEPQPGWNPGPFSGLRGLLPFLLILAFVGGSILRVFLGRLWGSLANATLVGSVVWLVAGMLPVALIAGTITFFVMLAAGAGRGAGGWSNHPRTRGWPGGGWSSGGLGGGGFSGGGFSGGGGSFGGGGASGSW